MIKSHINGNQCYFTSGMWLYMDGVSISKEIRTCPKCGKMPTSEGYDACLGYIDGAEMACCGHGITEGYIIY